MPAEPEQRWRHFLITSLILNDKRKNKHLINYSLNPFRSVGGILSFHTRCRAINRIGPHNKDIIPVIFGLLLGDGYLNRRSGEGVRLCIRQSIKHKDYLFFLYNFFNEKGYCINLKPRQYTRTIKNINKIYYGFEFNTYTFTSFNWIYNLFYKASGGKKNVLFLKDMNYVDMFFTPFTLAIWICDDGCWTNYGVRIYCNAFTLKEVELLVHILNYKFNLECTIQKIYIENQYSIYIKSNSIHTLREIVLPHMPKSMLYKLGLN